LRSLYFGSTSDDEKGCRIRPNKPRFCRVVVVIGVAVGAGGAKTEDVASGVTLGVLSCANAGTVDKAIEKMMAGRIIDGLNTKR